jgi:hypothetical protein
VMDETQLYAICDYMMGGVVCWAAQTRATQ